MLLQMAASSDVESARPALLALNNLAASETNHSSMIQKGIMRVVLITAYESTDEGRIAGNMLRSLLQICVLTQIIWQ